MALSNMLHEPRREIIETLIGVATLCIVVYLCYFFAINWPIHPIYVLLNMALYLLAGVVVLLLLLFIHFIGEEICNALEDHNIYLRPRRY